MIPTLLLISRWIGQAHDHWRVRTASRRPLAAEIDLLHERLEQLRGENEILRTRLLRLAPRRRPRFRPWQRLQILLHASRYALSTRATARTFLITVQTLTNWRKDAARGLKELVCTREPMNRLPDLVEQITRYLKTEWSGWGSRRIAGILARLGLKGSRTSVQRTLRRPGPPRPAKKAGVRRGSIRARRPGHVWIVDFTTVKSLFRSVVVAAVIDAFSRKVLAVRVSPCEPDAAFACRLMDEAIDRHGKPRWVVSDRGSQFTAKRFRRYLRRRRIFRRYAHVGNANLARIDRFWRTLKEEYARGLFLYRPIRTLERDLGRYALWHSRWRPHGGLGGITPDEIHAGKPRHRLRAVQEGELEVSHQGGDRRLPVFRLRRVA